MTRNPTTEPALRRVMGVSTLVVFGIAYMVPLTVFTTYGLVAVTTQGHVPTAYLVTVAAMSFTAGSYAAMVRVLPRAGSAYSYARRAFGGHVGFLTGWALMLDYVLLPLINYVLIGIYLNARFPAVPAWLFALVAVVAVTGLNIVGIAVVRNANLVLVGIQLVFVAVFVGTAIGYAADHPGTSLLQPLLGAGLSAPAVLSGAAIVALSFLGFDAISTLSEEAKNPERSVPRAILLTTVVAGVLFVGLSYVSELVQTDYTTIKNPDTAATEVMNIAGGQWLQIFFLTAYITGCVSSAMASQATVSRILFAMGRDRVLPHKVFAAVGKRFHAPLGATLVVGVISLAAAFADLNTLTLVINFGALVAFSLVNLSVIKHFVIDRGERSAKSLVVHGVFPTIGFLLIAWLWFSLAGLALTVGIIWVVAGVVYLAFLTRGFRRRPPEVRFDAPEESGEQGTTAHLSQA